MIKTFKLSFLLRNTYKANGIIYYLRQLPLIKRLILSTAYKSRGIKLFANIAAILLELVGAFLWKGIYMALIFAAIVSMGDGGGLERFLMAFFFLTLVGGFLNTNLFDPSNDKYYGIVLMHMDAKAYTLSNYIYFILKTFVGFLPFCCLFSALLGGEVLYGVFMAFYVASSKLLFAGCILWDTKRDLKKNKLTNTKGEMVFMWAAVGVLCALAFLPALAGFMLPMFFYGLVLFICLVGSVAALIYLFRCTDYEEIYRILLKQAPVYTLKTSGQENAAQKMTLKKIEYTAEGDNSKKGYAYFNDLFFKRHRRLLHKPAKRICVISVLFFVGASGACLFSGEASAVINRMLLNLLPYFLFIIYLIHPGRSITQAMFMNCDHSMLAFRFYRQPRVVIPLFVHRLKSLILIGLVPAVFIGGELTILLAISGGTSNAINYGLTFVTIVMMSVFFSVHYMVLYYLLQPYNVQLESRNAAYGIANWLTYMICYVAMGWRVSTLFFGTAVTVFSVIYIFVALLLVGRLAPKTFKLR